MYVQSNTLLLADVFENFRNTFLEKYELDPARFLTAPSLAWQAALMVEKGIRGGICHSIYRYAKANNKYMKNYDKYKESLCLQYWDVNTFYGWAMSQKLPVNNFEWIEDTLQFNEDFIKTYNEESDEGCFLEVDVQYPENLHNLHNDLPFFPERMKIGKVEKLVASLHDKSEYVIQKNKFKTSIKSWISFEKSS